MQRLVPWAAAAVLIASPTCRADEFTDQLDTARQYYEQGDYVAASEELRFALQSLQARVAERFVGTFPEPPAGWRAGEVEIQGGATFMGGGVALERTYANDAGARVKATLIANNAMVQSMAGMIELMATQPGARRVRLGRDNAVVSFDAGARSGKGTLVVGRALIQLDGDGLEGPKILEALPKSWDIQRVEELAG